jgi:hypothetical protein
MAAPAKQAKVKVVGYESTKWCDAKDKLLKDRVVFGDRKRSEYVRKGIAARERTGKTGASGKSS